MELRLGSSRKSGYRGKQGVFGRQVAKKSEITQKE